MKRSKETYSYETSSPDRYTILKANAKKNRSSMTIAERLLWQTLRHNRYKLKFRRQHPVDDFIADFVCIPYKLIIEVDGEYHNDEIQAKDDALRTEVLNKCGFKVVRFTNNQIMANIMVVAEAIYNEIFK